MIATTQVADDLWPPPAQRRHDEDDFQRQVVAFLRLALPADAVFYHPPNGGLRHKKAAARLNGLGVLAGVPDLAIVWQGRSVFVELKSLTGTLSTAQRNTHRRLVYAGAEVVTCKSLSCVEESLRELGIPLRCGIAA